ncbi:uncharacterized protein BKCO1_5100051 [Diplodia corticola]|uniref:DUF6594 domain-containing protein n=1 Tax=Diplodia corticola TaxID=236234 RepID=A0A1J9QTB4_9PEZI|nr:uncharacterized protein BKCO1_5100051 [Diplodia corticola]OJD31226.1 hypothetical protein BKCO1_5100051 [Diplodia corticola]
MAEASESAQVGGRRRSSDSPTVCGSDGNMEEEKEWRPSAFSSSDSEAESQTAPEVKRSWVARLFRSNSSEDPDDEINDTDVRALEDCPAGYPHLAAFQACEQSFMLYRGFSYVHARLILNLQAKIAALEGELDDVDEDDFGNEDTRVRLKSVARDIGDTKDAEDTDRHRQRILEELRVNVMHYDELLIKTKQIASLQRPTDRDYRSVRNYFYNFRPLVKKEEKYIRCREDIISLRSGREWAGFDQWVETRLLNLSRKLPFVKRWFSTRDILRKTDDADIRYLSPSRIERFVGLIITAVIFVLLILPVVGMYRLASFGDTKDIFSAIGVMIVFTLLFAAAMSLLTKARRHELFAASAAYCAILVVFITNV